MILTHSFNLSKNYNCESTWFLNILYSFSFSHFFLEDSASHVAEKVMRSLNECLGGGSSIAVPTEATLLDQLTEVSKDELKRIKEEQATKAAMSCAEAVKQRCNGKPCMKTSINSRLPYLESHLNFFFDEEFMMKCCANAS